MIYIQNSKKSNPLPALFVWTLIIVLVIFWLYYFFLGKFSDSWYNPDLSSIEWFYPKNYIEVNIEEFEFAWKKINDSNWQIYDIKERLEKEILITLNTSYQLILLLKRQEKFFNHIDQKLAENNMPLDLKYLAAAESYLHETAVSHAWAAWIWQFMPWTAKDFWLLINSYVDERYNFEKSTDAAISYLSKLNEKFDWDRFLAMAWYNMGGAWLQRAMDFQQTDNYFELVLNSETSRYVFRILALKYIMEKADELNINIPFVDWYKYPDYEIVEEKSIDNLLLYCQQKWVSLYTIEKLNPWIIITNNKLPERTDWENRKIKTLK